MSNEKIEVEGRMEDTQHGKFLTFALGEETFGIEIRYVTEIIGMQHISQMPEMPGYIKGIINLRGRIIPVMDMRARFKLDAIAYTDRTCIVVIDNHEFSVGLIVDHVAEVIAIDDENIVDPPDSRIGVQNRYIRGIGKVKEEVTMLLDCDKLFNEEECLLD